MGAGWGSEAVVTNDSYTGCSTQETGDAKAGALVVGAYEISSYYNLYIHLKTSLFSTSVCCQSQILRRSRFVIQAFCYTQHLRRIYHNIKLTRVCLQLVEVLQHHKRKTQYTRKTNSRKLIRIHNLCDLTTPELVRSLSKRIVYKQASNINHKTLAFDVTKISCIENLSQTRKNAFLLKTPLLMGKKPVSGLRICS